MVKRRVKRLSLLLPMCLLSCSNVNIGMQDSKLKPCPASPNCVSTETSDSKHQIAPFKIKGSPLVFWQKLEQQLELLPKTKIITVTDTYLHVECRSKFFSFVDDLEFLLRTDTGVVEIRSAARLGYSDLGVNRQRLEGLRSTLTLDGVLD